MLNEGHVSVIRSYKPFILCRSHPIAIAENYERPGNES